MDEENAKYTQASIYKIVKQGEDTYLPYSLEHVRYLPNELLNKFTFVYLKNADLILVAGGSDPFSSMLDKSYLFDLLGVHEEE